MFVWHAKLIMSTGTSSSRSGLDGFEHVSGRSLCVIDERRTRVCGYQWISFSAPTLSSETLIRSRRLFLPLLLVLLSLHPLSFQRLCLLLPCSRTHWSLDSFARSLTLIPNPHRVEKYTMGKLEEPDAIPSAPAAGSVADKNADIVVNDRDHILEAASSSDGEEVVDPNAQAGVQDIEAVTSVWTSTSLIIAYAMIWVIYFVMLMQQGALATLTPFVTSSFAEHSLTPTVTVISSIIGGVFKLTLAKILDVFGRPQGYLLSIFLATIGLIMMAACKTVEQYAAAQVFYTVGQNALLYTINIFIADTTSLRSRSLMVAFASSPNIITVWLSGPISEAFLAGPGWRWAFGTFSIVVPFIALPLFGLFMYNFNKAKKQGLVPKRDSERTVLQSIIYYGREFDAVGLLLASAGMALFLLPFNIYSLQEQGWRAPLIICLIVFGFVLLVLFVLWEKLFAPVTFVPYSILLDRTVLGACILSSIVFMSYYIWAIYFTSFLMVVQNLSITNASYVFNAYNVGSPLWALAVGWLIRRTGRFKFVSAWFGVPLQILGLGLMINFLQADDNVGYLVMCLIFLGFSAGAIIMCDQIAVMAAASHQQVAVLIAVESMFAEIGGAIGLTVAAAIWQEVFPKKLAEYLPTEDLPNLLMIYGDLTTQLLYPVGSAGRIAIQHAYADAQKMMLIAATALWAIGLGAVFMWRDINLAKIKQVKGHVI
ncbi:siderophore iron transporter mirB [Dactylonectria estremocensis]|uniref:Siderophore iron transporter mirB n=1 Tax=Dactylonectria estremocensis TaxID=1079267 RepID=A0A9P9E2R1_9HYPO|nr:siderophore iron transporter mirB [Dactylonectria estremocensis]